MWNPGQVKLLLHYIVSILIRTEDKALTEGGIGSKPLECSGCIVSPVIHAGPSVATRLKVVAVYQAPGWQSIVFDFHSGGQVQVIGERQIHVRNSDFIAIKRNTGRIAAFFKTDGSIIASFNQQSASTLVVPRLQLYTRIRRYRACANATCRGEKIRLSEKRHGIGRRSQARTRDEFIGSTD